METALSTERIFIVIPGFADSGKTIHHMKSYDAITYCQGLSPQL
jgi:hypothetical protein